jgi:two-component system cell cycle sensor histidine kinase/response regulator CckA
MEAIGRLAGGIAHDFNNLLTAISGYAEVLRDDLGPDDPRTADAVEITKASDRAASLTRQLLAFSRRQVLQPQVMDLNSVLMDVQPMLARLIGEDVRVRTRVAPDPVLVRADPGQITQVLMNLAVNARDAMPRGGTLSIETGSIRLDDAFTRTHPGMRPGAHALLTVTDTGRGMDRETMANLFEPFFTTKEVGQGTGLGLATVYGIVKQSGGSIWAYSEPGRGTTFKIYLPAAASADDLTEPAELPPAPDRAVRTETILLVEDEEAVRAFVTRLLDRAGYRALVAATPDEADAIAGAHPGRIDLLVTDVVMPGRNGAELAAGLQVGRPGMRTLFMSGYTEDAIVHDGVLDAGVAFIGKPFAQSAFLAKVRDTLDREPHARPR